MNDDLDQEVIGAEEGFDEFAQKNTLGDLWRNNPLVKVGIVIFVVAIIALIATMFGGGDNSKTDPSMITAGSSDISSTPGATEGATPAYIQAVEEQNAAELERALQTGDSTLPVPVEAPTDRLVAPEEEETQTEDPLMRWRRLQEERLSRDIENQTEIEPVVTVDSEQQNEAIKKLSESMAAQMQTILGRGADPKKFTYVKIQDYTKVEKENSGQNSNDAGSAPQSGQPENSGFSELDSEGIEEEVQREILIPAGEIEYAQLITEANSDIPGPVLAQLVSGPLSGSKLLGSFSVSEQDYMAITFDTVVVDGESYTISAVALDPATTLPGMATEVDHRYFKRIILPAAAAFVEGFADAISENDSTSITIEGDTTTSVEESDKSTEQEVALGVKEAGEEIRDIIDEEADETQVMVKIHAGTPIGVLFTEPVVQEDEGS